MTKKIIAIILCFSFSGYAIAGGGVSDDPVLFKFMIDQLEYRDAKSSNPTVFEGEMWIGKDLNKLWIKTDIERVDGETEEAELQLLYSRAIASYWDLQVGFRRDFKPKPTRDWAVVGVKGLAPYFFEVDAALFFGDNGRTALRLEAEYELMLTQKWVLSPEATAEFHGQNDAATGAGSGLSKLSLGVRLRYEIRREFAPYIGVYWSKQYGNTADFTRADGGDVSDTQFVIGIRAWF